MRAGLWAVVALAWATGAFAEDVLKSQGLIRSGSFYVLEVESNVHTKLEEASAQFESFAAVVAQQAAIVESEMQLKALDLQGVELRRRIDNINVQLGQFPGRRNSVQRMAFNGLSAERDGYQVTLNEINGQIGVLRNQAATPKQKQNIEAELMRRREPLLTALRAIRIQIDDATKRYQELAGRGEVQAALEAQRRTAKVNLKLGPSNELRGDVALLRKYEKMVQPASSNAGSASKTRSTNGRKAGH
jgi:hypothetical protein